MIPQRSFLLASFLLLTTHVWAQQRQVLYTSVAAPAGARVIDRLDTSQHLGLALTLGPANQPDAVNGTGQPIALPAGQFALMRMLATGVDGEQKAQSITVTYIDDTTSQFTQLQRLVHSANYPGELEAIAMATAM
jgi:hypothetical protein